MAEKNATLDRLRKLCLAMPRTTEVRTWGHPTFRVGKKIFAVLEEYRGERCLCFKATIPAQQELIEDPRFFVAPYVGRHGWVSMRVGGAVDWREVETLILTSYRLVATKRKPSAF